MTKSKTFACGVIAFSAAIDSQLGPKYQVWPWQNSFFQSLHDDIGIYLDLLNTSEITAKPASRFLVVSPKPMRIPFKVLLFSMNDPTLKADSGATATPASSKDQKSPSPVGDPSHSHQRKGPATRLINLTTPVDVICLAATLSWFSPRLRSIYHRGILVFARGGLRASVATRRVGFGALALANGVYEVSERMRRFIERSEREVVL